jgi:predicted MarR family transcription regulator
MANSKHISEDEIKYIVDVESAKAQQEIRKLEKASASLRSENKRRLDQMIKLEAQGKKDSQHYKDLRENYNQVSKKIKENTEQIGL